MSHGFTPSTSSSSCYASPSSILPCIPLHMSSHSVHRNVGSGNLCWQHGLQDGSLGPELTGEEYRRRQGGASSTATPIIQDTSFNGHSIVHMIGNNFLFPFGGFTECVILLLNQLVLTFKAKLCASCFSPKLHVQLTVICDFGSHSHECYNYSFVGHLIDRYQHYGESEDGNHLPNYMASHPRRT
jgi:hypothetical protein